MLRPLLACFTASALLLVVACSKTAGSDASTPEDTPPTTESDQTGEKKTQSTEISSSSSGAPTDPSTDGTSSSGSVPVVVEQGGDVSDKVDVSEVKITVNGEGRRYLVAVPKNYDANKAYPLIIGLHGDGGSAEEFLKSSKLTQASGDQAIVAFPDQSVDLFTTYTNNNDQRLVSATIIQLKKNRNIDAGKIWGFGYSKGAFMLNEMGCRKPGLFTAIAPHAGGAPQEVSDDEDGCPAAQGLAVFATMGTNDDLEGGQFEADYWAGLGGCSTSTQTSDKGTAPAACKAYKNCDNQVLFCKVEGFGHTPLYASAATDSWNWFNSL